MSWTDLKKLEVRSRRFSRRSPDRRPAAWETLLIASGPGVLRRLVAKIKNGDNRMHTARSGTGDLARRPRRWPVEAPGRPRPLDRDQGRKD